MKSVLIIVLCIFFPSISFSKDDMVEKQIPKRKLDECTKLLALERAESFNIRVKLELEKIRHTRDVKLLQLKTERLTDRIYNFAFLAFIGFSFGLYAFRKRRDE
jgi:hypothetical protein